MKEHSERRMIEGHIECILDVNKKWSEICRSKIWVSFQEGINQKNVSFSIVGHYSWLNDRRKMFGSTV